MIATSFTSSSAAFREKEISFAANWVRKQFTTAEPLGFSEYLSSRSIVHSNLYSMAPLRGLLYFASSNDALFVCRGFSQVAPLDTSRCLSNSESHGVRFRLFRSSPTHRESVLSSDDVVPSCSCVFLDRARGVHSLSRRIAFTFHANLVCTPHAYSHMKVLLFILSVVVIPCIVVDPRCCEIQNLGSDFPSPAL